MSATRPRRWRQGVQQLSCTAYQDEGGSSKGEECHVDERRQLGQGLPQLLMQGLAGCLTPAWLAVSVAHGLLDSLKGTWVSL